MSTNPTIQSPSELGVMSGAKLDLVAQAASASGFNPYDILYGPPPSDSSASTPGPRASTPIGMGMPDSSFSDSTISIPIFPESPIPSPPPTPSPTPRSSPGRGRGRGRGRGPRTLRNLSRDQVRAQGINPMQFMTRPRRTISRRGGRGRITAPARSPSPMPSSLNISFGSNASSRSGRGE